MLTAPDRSDNQIWYMHCAVHLTHFSTSKRYSEGVSTRPPGSSCHFRLQGRRTYLLVLTFFLNNITDYRACCLSPCLFFQTSKRNIILSLCHVYITRKLLSFVRTWQRNNIIFRFRRRVSSCQLFAAHLPHTHTHTSGGVVKVFRIAHPGSSCRLPFVG